MKASELTGQSDEQLAQILQETEKHLFQLKFQAATDRLEKSSELSKAKKDIARILTEQNRREHAKSSQKSPEVIAKTLETLQGKVEGPGKRKVKRQINRLEMQMANNTAQKSAKGK